jgi:hypothetical protein
MALCGVVAVVPVELPQRTLTPGAVGAKDVVVVIYGNRHPCQNQSHLCCLTLSSRLEVLGGG